MDDGVRKFVFGLALELGMTVKDIGDRMTVDELREWIAYYQISPFGHWRHDLNAAYVCMSMAGTKDTKLSDFMPDFNPIRPKIQDVADRLSSYFKGHA